MTKKQKQKKEDDFLPPDPENAELANMPVYSDTRNIMPGMIVYTIAPYAVTPEIPYTTFGIEPRIITQIHDSGVNGGTLFLTYKYEISPIIGDKTKFQLKAIDDILYSPLTKEHAEYIAKKLNEQAKQKYLEHRAKLDKVR